MTNPLMRIIRRDNAMAKPLEVDWSAIEEMPGIEDAIKDFEEEIAIKVEPLAEESAASFLRKSLNQLHNDDAALTAKINELSERLRSVKLTAKSFHTALATIEADEKQRDAKMPQAVQFTGVAG